MAAPMVGENCERALRQAAHSNAAKVALIMARARPL
jgi:hypothetical protein